VVVDLAAVALESESDPASGRGYASIAEGELRGRIYFFNGDSSDFRATTKG